MYGVASEISTRAAFSVPTFISIPSQAYTYAKKIRFNTAQVS